MGAEALPVSRTPRVPVHRPHAAGVDLLIVSTYRADSSDEQDLELPVEELLRRARPLPPHDEMLIEGVTVDEGSAFLAAVDS